MRFSFSGRISSGFALVPVLALGAALLPAGPAQASPGRPAAQVARAAAGVPFHRAGLAQARGADGPAAPRIPAGTVASPPSIPVGTGPVKNGTFLSFAVSDRVSLRVNVGSGDALVTTSDVAVPEIGSTLTLGASYNSLLTGSGVATGAEGSGWRQRQGVDVQLYPASSDKSVTLVGPDGTAGKFTAPASGSSTFGSPAEFQATLSNAPTSTCSGSAYQLTWHQSGEVMCFTTAGLLTSEADRNGNTTAYAYNAAGQETQVTYTPKGAPAATRTVTASYTGTFLTGLSQSGGTAGTRTVAYTVNASTGNLSSVKQADGTLISFGYDSSHDLTSIQNGASNITTLGYNSAHQVTSVIQPTTGTATATTRLDYVSATETLVADPNTNQSDAVTAVPVTTYTIAPASSLVTKAVDQGGNTRSNTYTSFDDVQTSTNGLTGKTTSTYGSGAAGQPSPESLTRSQSPTGAAGSVAYGNPVTASNPTAAFQPSSSNDAQGNTSLYTYDGAGNLDQSSDALPATSKVTDNSDGTPKNSTNPAGGVTSYAYTDGNHELNTVTPPSGGSLQPVTVTYDGFGRMATKTDGAGNTVTYTYDLANRVTRAAHTGGPKTVTVTYAYDGAGNLTTQADSSGTTTYAYDGLNLITSKTATSGGGTLTYGYNLDGNLNLVKDGGGTTTYVYSDRNLLISLTDPAGNLWEFAYNADGQRTKTWFATNTAESAWAAKTVTAYDPGGRISELTADRNSSTASPLSDTSYCYTKFASGVACPTATATSDRSLLQYSVNNVTGKVSQYTYDTGNRLKTATNINGSSTFTYGYDADGNMTTGADAGTLAYNTDNQITTSGYAYDGAGKLTADPASGTLAYNDAGQMTSASNAGGNGPETFAYAGDTQDQVLSDGTASGITYGLNGQDGQPWIQSYSGNYIIRDQRGTPLGVVSAGQASAYVTDNNGSITAIISSAGTAGSALTYDPYGKATVSGTQLGNQIGYTGALTDTGFFDSDGIPETGYIHDGDRWYNPQTSTFTTTDPVTLLDNPASANPYPYAADNPANNIDPTGQWSWSYFIAGASILGATVVGIGVILTAPIALTAIGLYVVAAGVGISGFASGAAFGCAFRNCS